MRTSVVLLLALTFLPSVSFGQNSTPPPVSRRPVSNSAERARLRFVQQHQTKERPVQQRNHTKNNNARPVSVLHSNREGQRNEKSPRIENRQRAENGQRIELVRERIKAVNTVQRTRYVQDQEGASPVQRANIPPAPAQNNWELPGVEQPANLAPPKRVAENPYPTIPSQPARLTDPKAQFPSGSQQDLPVPNQSISDLPIRSELPRKQEPSSVMAAPQQVDPSSDPFSDQNPRFRPSRVRTYQDPASVVTPSLRNPQNNPIRQESQELNNGSATSNFKDMNCDEFRQVMMGDSIRTIDLNISPHGPQRREVVAGASRNWSDRYGNVLTTGSMTKLRHGYVYVDTGSGVVRLAAARLSDSDLAEVAKVWDIPEACTLGVYDYQARCWTPQTVTWKASAACHKPLFFEDIQLERYGHSAGPFRQPIRSTAHFFGSLVFLPYQMGYQSPTECRYALGYYRPGNCAPWLVDPIPISLSGAVRQATSAVGGSYLFFP